MLDITNKIKIPMDKPISRITVPVKQNNINSRKISFTLTQNGVVYSLDKVRVAAVRGIKPDGNKIYNDCLIRENEIVYEITSETIAVQGTVSCELVLFGEDYKEISSSEFFIEVHPELFDDSFIESRNEYNVLQKCISECVTEVAKSKEHTKRSEEILNATTELEEKLKKYIDTVKNFEKLVEECKKREYNVETKISSFFELHPDFNNIYLSDVAGKEINSSYMSYLDALYSTYNKEASGGELDVPYTPDSIASVLSFEPIIDGTGGKIIFIVLKEGTYHIYDISGEIIEHTSESLKDMVFNSDLESIFGNLNNINEEVEIVNSDITSICEAILTINSNIMELNSDMQEVFQSVSDGKELVASAITDKGVATKSDATYQTMADNIQNISGGISNSVYSKINNASSNVDSYSHISNNNCAYADSNALSCELMSNTDGWCLTTVATRSPATFPDDWILLKQIEISQWSTYPQVMSIFTRQVVEGEVVNFSCSQLDSNLLYINMIIMNCNGFEVNDGTENLFIGGYLKSNTVPKVYNKCVWCCSSVTWLRGSKWSSVGLTEITSSKTSSPRLCNFIDIVSAFERTFTAYDSKATNFMIDSVKIL